MSVSEKDIDSDLLYEVRMKEILGLAEKLPDFETRMEKATEFFGGQVIKDNSFELREYRIPIGTPNSEFENLSICIMLYPENQISVSTGEKINGFWYSYSTTRPLVANKLINYFNKRFKEIYRKIQE